MKWTCRPCGDRELDFVDLEEVSRHLAEHGHESERWPDGDLVVVDMTLTPGDFEAGETPK